MQNTKKNQKNEHNELQKPGRKGGINNTRLHAPLQKACKI